MEQWTPKGCSLTAYGRPLLIGFAAGTLGGLFGVGGAVIKIPAMVYLLHVSQHRAHGTSLASSLAMALTGAVAYSMEGTLPLLGAVEVAVGMIAGAILGAHGAHKLSGKRLTLAYGTFLLVVSVMMALKATGHWNEGAAAGTLLLWPPWGIFIGFFAGVLAGLLGIGGGMVIVPALVLLLNVPQQTAQGISLAVIVPASVSGAAVYHKKGNMDLQLAVLIAIGGGIAAWISAGWANSMNAQTLQGIFALFLATMGIAMIRKKQPPARSEGVKLNEFEYKS